MVNVSSEQIKNRFEELPEILKNALFSVINADYIWQISLNYKITEPEKISKIRRIVSLVILGFLKIDGVAKEIQENLDLNQELAIEIAKELEFKIFSPIKNDINQLNNKAFNNMSDEVRYQIKFTNSSMPLQQTSEKILSGQNPAPNTTIKAQIPPFNRVEIITPPPSAIPAKTTPPQQNVQNIPQPQSQPRPAANQTSNAPVMLYQKQEQKPVAESIKSRIVGEIEINVGMKPEASSVPARIEIGPEFPKVVHYNDFKTPINAQGQKIAPTTPAIAKLETISPPNEEVVDLSSFKPERKTEPPGQLANTPKTQGNTLDLR